MTVLQREMSPPDMIGLAETKFHAPARRHDLLTRPRLVEAVKGGLDEARLTLISAPAGAGKTSLLAELPHAMTEVRWAWLLLDEEDNDPSRFAAAMTNSLARAVPGFGEVNPGNGQGGRQAVGALINRVMQCDGETVALVIDDFHTITEPAAHQSFEYLIDRLPPNLRVVVASRQDPPAGLSRWRARGEVRELRLPDLAFTEEETEELVNLRLQLGLEPQEIRSLRERTQGWAAGLRLLATSVAQAPATSRVLLERGMEGRQRVFEFLAEEVLDRQPAGLRDFLLSTSILGTLSPRTCDLLTGRTDSREVLEDLYRRNLYVVAADENGSHFRYHDLFADFLRDRLHRERPQDTAALHAKAAAAECDPARRVRHWAAAGMWDAAAGEIERIGNDCIRRGYAFTLRRWVLDLPEAVRLQHPRLALLLGSAIWAQSELQEAQPYLEEALDGFRRKGDAAGQGETLVALAITAIMLRESARAQELYQEALRYPLPSACRLELHAARGWDALNREDWGELHRNLNELLDLLGEPAVASNPFVLVLLLYGTSFPEFNDRLEQGLGRNREALENGSDFVRSYYYALRASCLLFRGDVEAALRAAQAARQIGSGVDQPLIVRLSGMVSQILGGYAAGDFAMAEEAAKSLQNDSLTQPFMRRWRTAPAYMRGRACWLAGDTAGVERCLQEIARPGADELPDGQVYRVMLEGILHLCSRAYAKAQERLEEAVRLQSQYPVTTGSSSAAVLLAYVHLKRGNMDEAAELFEPYLATGEQLNGPGYLMRENPIVVPLLRLMHERGRHRAFVERVMALLGEPLQATEEVSGESLSARELEVLRVMAGGLSNKEIGERLFVSEATVKTHVQRILRKMDANSRTQAVARAREWMLL